MDNKNAIEFVNVSKFFGNIKANKNVSFKVEKGTIHALIGENGAGKSTLTSILFGLYEPTHGYLKINGKQIIVKNPNEANELGIGMVHQHFKLVDVYSNLENIIIGSEFTKKSTDLLDLALSKTKIEAIQNLYNLHFDLKQKTGKATVATQQKVEIMKMLYRDSDILIFDEPTAVLTDQEIQGLLKTFLEFKKNGKTIIFISHKLKEIKEVADKATVLRKGEVVGTYDVATTSISTLAQAMVGKKVVLPKNENKVNFLDKEPILEFHNISAKADKSLYDISFDLHPGEILAFAGVEGNGQETLEYVLSGILKPKKGKIYARIKENNCYKITYESGKTVEKTISEYVKKDITKWNVSRLNEEAKINVVPGDRHKYGLVLDFTIEENSILRSLKDPSYTKTPFLSFKKRYEMFKQIKQNFDVRGTNDGFSLARSLSGGNQQKAIVGREMTKEHEILVIVQPTRGLDVGAIDLIHSKIINEKKNNKGIILISYELDEVLALADTIAVINGGKILDIKPAQNFTREEIGILMSESHSQKVEGGEDV